MTLLSYSQDTTQTNLKPTVFLINGDTNFCFTPQQSKSILIVLTERNTYKSLYNISEQDSEKCNEALNKYEQVIETYKSDSTQYNDIIEAQDLIIDTKGKQIAERDDSIRTLKTHRFGLGIITIVVTILGLL